MKKIQFIKLLINKAGFSLKNAKSLKDKLANDNEIIEIEILDENLAKEILDESQKLKVKCRIRIR